MTVTHRLGISGMTCDHCAQGIEKTLASVAGVIKAVVSYPDGIAHIQTTSEVAASELVEAIEAKSARSCRGKRETARARGAPLGGRQGPLRSSAQEAGPVAHCDHRKRRGGLRRGHPRCRGGCSSDSDRARHAGGNVCQRGLRALQDHDPGGACGASPGTPSI